MHIKSVEFAGAIGQVGQAVPANVEGLVQVAFAGRSNVGKSTLINQFLGRTRTPIARVSSTPGKTQEINFFRVRSDLPDFALVDLPGYGYARAPTAVVRRWRELIHAFLADSKDLKGVVQLIDIRHGPSDEDSRSLGYLAELQIPILFVLTKADKLGAQKRREAIRKIGLELNVDEGQLIAVSAITRAGIDDLHDALSGLLNETAKEAVPSPPSE